MRLLLDVGEGVSEWLGNRIFAIENIFISHDHLDHIAGLPSLLGHRRSARGDKAKPLTIVCTAPKIAMRVREFIQLTFGDYQPGYEITVRVLPFGGTMPLNGQGVMLSPFRTNHTHNSGGAVIFRRSRRLRAELREDAAYLIRIHTEGVRPGSEDYEKFDQPKVIYALDNNGLDCSMLGFDPAGADLMIDDLTFPEGHENADKKHNDCAGIVRNIEEFRPKNLLLSHLSSRYRGANYTRLLEDITQRITGGLSGICPNLTLHRPQSTSDITTQTVRF